MTIPAINVGKTGNGAAALVALGVLFLGLIILLTFLVRGARIDLTESNLYSIAPGTERILESLPELGVERVGPGEMARLDERRLADVVAVGVLAGFEDRAGRMTNLEPDIPQRVKDLLD